MYLKRHTKNPGSKLVRALMLSSAAAGLATLAPPPAALAQADAAADDDRDVVYVTARKREENIQDVPLAITAFGAEDIARRGITELDDVARFTAGFAFEDFDGSNASPVIRGQSQINVAGLEQNVATFLDGIYLPRSWMVDLGTTNLARIEIIKGPQSARYGRNAFSGAINYIPKKAGQEFEAVASVTVGNHERLDYGVALGVPVVEDFLSVRASYDSSEFDGSWENTHPFADFGFSPGTNGNVGGWETESYSANLLFTPTERVTVDISYYGFEREQETRAAVWQRSNAAEGNCGNLGPIGTFDFNQTGPQAPRLFCGELGEPADTVLIEPRSFARQSDGDIFRASLEVDLTDAITTTYLFGIVEAETLNAYSIESDPVICGGLLGPSVNLPTTCNFQATPLGELHYESHDLRFAYDDGGSLTFAVGGFLSDGQDDFRYISVNVPPLSATNTAPINIVPQSTSFPDLSNFVLAAPSTTTKARAVFGEFMYVLPNERTTLSGEVRYTSEKIRTIGNRSGFMREETFNFVTPRVTVEHGLSEDALIYASAARGAKAGGFNSGGIMQASQVYGPEFNWTYELGAKQQFLGGRAVVNTAVFLTKWKDQQINAADPDASILNTTIIRNLGDATIWGLEFEGSLQATDNISLDGTVAYVNSTFDDGTIDQRFASFGGAFLVPPCDDIVCASNGDVSGNRLERAPSVQASAGAEWEDQLPFWSGEYYLRGDVSYQSSHFADPMNLLRAPNRTIVNMSAGVSFEHVDVVFWARNLTDKRYASNAFQILQAQGTTFVGEYLGERRTFGVTATARY